MKLPPKRPANASRLHLRKGLEALSQKLGPIKMRPIASLRNYARNPRKHPESQLVALTASIRQFGFTMPVLVDPGGELIAGEARLAAAVRAGLTDVPALVAHQWSRAQVKAYRLADNRIAENAAWDADLLAAEILEVISFDEVSVDALGWTTAEIEVILDKAEVEEAGQCDPADVEVKLPATPVARVGDLWLLDEHRLFCGSGLEDGSWERLMNGMTAAMSFIDSRQANPDAGQIGRLEKTQHADLDRAPGESGRGKLVSFLTKCLTLTATHCKDGAVIDVCIDWRQLTELYEALVAAGLAVTDLCVWNKTSAAPGLQYRPKHELIFIAKKGRALHRDNLERGKSGRSRCNVWNYAAVKSVGAGGKKDLAERSTVMPVALVADAILDVTSRGDIVVDALMGLGTTLLAAERTGRVGYGMDIDPSYVDVAICRWQSLTGGLAVHEGTGKTFAEVAVQRRSDAHEGEEHRPDEHGESAG